MVSARPGRAAGPAPRLTPSIFFRMGGKMVRPRAVTTRHGRSPESGSAPTAASISAITFGRTT